MQATSVTHIITSSNYFSDVFKTGNGSAARVETDRRYQAAIIFLLTVGPSVKWLYIYYV